MAGHTLKRNNLQRRRGNLLEVDSGGYEKCFPTQELIFIQLFCPDNVTIGRSKSTKCLLFQNIFNSWLQFFKICLRIKKMIVDAVYLEGVALSNRT